MKVRLLCAGAYTGLENVEFPLEIEAEEVLNPHEGFIKARILGSTLNAIDAGREVWEENELYAFVTMPGIEEVFSHGPMVELIDE